MKSCDTVPLSHLEKYFSEITFLLLFQHPKFSLSKSKHVKICGQKKSIEISWFVSFNIFWLLEYLKSISKEYRSNRIKSLIFKMTLGFHRLQLLQSWFIFLWMLTEHCSLLSSKRDLEIAWTQPAEGDPFLAQILKSQSSNCDKLRFGKIS